jgi:hypothetical protein
MTIEKRPLHYGHNSKDAQSVDSSRLTPVLKLREFSVGLHAAAGR